MSRANLLLLALLGPLGCSYGKPWNTQVADDSTFSVQFPGPHILHHKEGMGKDGVPYTTLYDSPDANIIGPTPGKDDLVVDVYILKDGNNVYAVSETTRPQSFKLTKEGKGLASMEADFADVTPEAVKALKDKSEKITIDGHPGVRAKMSQNNMESEIRAVRAGDHIYTLLCAAPTGQVDAGLRDTFFKSFKLLKG